MPLLEKTNANGRILFLLKVCKQYDGDTNMTKYFDGEALSSPDGTDGETCRASICKQDAEFCCYFHKSRKLESTITSQSLLIEKLREFHKSNSEVFDAGQPGHLCEYRTVMLSMIHRSKEAIALIPQAPDNNSHLKTDGDSSLEETDDGIAMRLVGLADAALRDGDPVRLKDEILEVLRAKDALNKNKKNK